jgi:2,3-dihydroxybiphenyl 1,2-dioxygenase
MNGTVSQLGYLGLEVRSLRRWTGFATQVLGLELLGDASGEGHLLRMDGNHHRLALTEGPRDDVAYAGWQVRTQRDLEALARSFEEGGTDVRWGSAELAEARRVQALFSVEDPGGLTTEVFTGPRRADGRPLRSPRRIGGFVADELGLGHIVLCVEDMEASLRFYRDGLGLKLSDFIDLELGEGGVMTVAFLHAGPRHHSLALVPTAAPRRLHHFMLELLDPDDVGRTLDVCRDREVPVSMGLGKHTNDGMLSFYMESPSGFQVEIGAGGVLIDDATWEVRRHGAASVWGHRPPA